MRVRKLVGTAALAGAAVYGVGTTSLPMAQADDTATTTTAAAPVVVSTSVTTLPLFGAQLTVDLSTGPGGTISSVAVNPADGLTATADRPNKVVFVNDAGTAKVVVRTGHGGQQVEAKAGSLDDFVSGGGAGGWSGDVFGTGSTTTVAYTVAKAADGTPDLSGVTTSDTSAVIGAVQHSSHGSQSEAKVTITFTNGGQRRSLSIRVEAGTAEDGASRAKVSVGLGRIEGVSLPADQVAGAHTWNGVLCDGTAASVGYTIGADGAISDVAASPAATTQVNGNHVDIRFSDREAIRIRLRTNDGTVSVSVDERIRCDAADPTVNTPIATTTTSPSSSTPPEGSDDSGTGGPRGGAGHGSGGRHGGAPGEG